MPESASSLTHNESASPTPAKFDLPDKVGPMLQDTLRPVYYAISDMPSVRDRALRSAIGSMYRQWCAANPCPESPARFDLYRSVLDSEHLGSAIDYLEFGVWEGE